MSVPSARGFLLLRRGGGLWGIANSAVDGLARQGMDYRITIDGGALAADEILGVVEELRVRPLAPAVSRFWSEAAAGLAVHGREPVVVVDPTRPPAVLRIDPEQAMDPEQAEEEGDRRDEIDEGRG